MKTTDKLESISNVNTGAVIERFATGNTVQILCAENPQLPFSDIRKECTGGGAHLSGVSGDGGGNVRYNYDTWGADQNVYDSNGHRMYTNYYNMGMSSSACGPLYDY